MSDLDVVVWGATGFTGGLVAEYLAENEEARASRWAIAGRNRQKLEALRDALGPSASAGEPVSILVGDAEDRSSLDAIASKARVVCATAGPFARYGSGMVAACAEHGTHYCDITGEAQWIRRMIDAHHEEARASGARIVHTCGYDSIPSDLGCYMLHDHVRSVHGGRLLEVTHVAADVAGAFSGGTVASMLHLVDEVKADPKLRKLLGNPYALCPEGAQSGPSKDEGFTVRWDEDYGGYVGPFVMAAINTRVVHRSNALLDHAYGPDFVYSEVMGFGPGIKGMVGAGAVALGIPGFMVAAATPPLRALLERYVLPAPGDGPSREKREAGHFTSLLYGRAESSGGRPLSVEAEIHGEQDPGYGETAKMLAQSALCLAKDSEMLPEASGVLTPASAMGMRLVERLEAAGMRWSTKEGRA